MEWVVIDHEDEYLDILANVLHDSCDGALGWYTAGRAIAALREYGFEVVPRKLAKTGAVAAHLSKRDEHQNPWAAGWNDCLNAIEMAAH